MAKKFLVTGGAGFIGSAVVRKLIRDTSHQVLVVDKLTYAGNLDSLSPASTAIATTSSRPTSRDAAQMRAIVDGFQPDVIMHLAAESHVDRSIDGPGEFVQTNVVGTFTLLQAALAYWRRLAGRAPRPLPLPPYLDRRGVRLARRRTASSTRNIPTSRTRPIRPPRLPPTISSGPGTTPTACQRSITNCSNNYGPYHFPEKLIPLIILNALEGKPLPVYGKGENVRDWLYVDDHADALILVAEQGRAGESYNIGGWNERTNIDVVRAICALMDELAPDARIGPREDLITFVTDRPGHDLRYAIDARKIERELGWRPAETFESGLRKTVAWYLDNRAWWERVRSGVYRGERLGIAV